jgi:hypothetical protein
MSFWRLFFSLVLPDPHPVFDEIDVRTHLAHKPGECWCNPKHD